MATCPNCLSTLEFADAHLDSISEFQYTNSALHPCACPYCGHIFSVDTDNGVIYERADWEELDFATEFALRMMQVTYAAVQVSSQKHPHEN